MFSLLVLALGLEACKQLAPCSLELDPLASLWGRSCPADGDRVWSLRRPDRTGGPFLGVWHILFVIITFISTDEMLSCGLNVESFLTHI